jgi:glycerol-3-phosphate dehydrogenase
MRCTGFLKEGDRVIGVKASDAETGKVHELRARVVLNATGVFVDELRHRDQPAAVPLVKPSQGVHLVLAREFLPGETALLIPKTTDGRVLFAVPWHDHVIVGTTDTPVDRPALEPRALEKEIELILTNAARYLARPPTRTDVLSVFAGLRPLAHRSAVEHTAALSRRHVIEVAGSGLITITGGKWTTYRQMAEEVVDRAEQCVGLPRRRCVTEGLALDDDVDEAVTALAASEASLAQALHPQLPYRRADVVWAVREAMARTVEDVLARRTRALFLDAQASIEAAEDVAAMMAAELGWSVGQAAVQVQQYREFARGYLLGSQ